MKKPMIRTTQDWQAQARSELSKMKSAASAAPLVETLKEAMTDFEKNKSRLVLFRKQPKDNVAGCSHEEETLSAVLSIVNDIKAGGDVRVNLEGLTIVPSKEFIQNLVFGEIIDMPDAIQNVQEIGARLKNWKSEKRFGVDAELDIFTEDAYRTGAPVYGDILSNIKHFRKIAASACYRIVDAATSAWSLKMLAETLQPADIQALTDFASLGKKKVGAFIQASKKAERGRGNGDRAQALADRFSLACPGARETLRAQWDNEREASFKTSEPAPPIAEGKIPQPPQSVFDDSARIRFDHPALFKRAMKPNAVEERFKAIRNEATRLRRAGVGYGDISDALKLLFRPGAISDIQETPQESAVPQIKSTKRSESVRTRNAAQAVPTPAPTTAPQNTTMDRDEFISSIVFNDDVRTAIRDWGLSTTDVLFSMFKGFNLGYSHASVGGGHMRGAIIRKNIRRYLAVAYEGRRGDAPEADDILRFMRSVGLIKTFGSGASTKTKDDAMALEPSPIDPIGSEMMRTATAALLAFKRQSTGSGS
jgi:hypothetical protein